MLQGIVGGAHVLTDMGECRVEHLTPGDRLIDAQEQSITLVEIARSVSRGTGNAAPIRVARGALGNHRAIALAPGQLACVDGALVAARTLVDGITAEIAFGGMVTYYRLMLERATLIRVEGTLVACGDVPVETAALAPITAAPCVAARPI